MRSLDLKYDYNFELSESVRTEPFLNRCIDSNTQKASDSLPQSLALFISFLSSPLMRGFLELLNSVAKINRQNVINRIPFNCILSFLVKNLDEFLRSFEKVARLSYPQNS